MARCVTVSSAGAGLSFPLVGLEAYVENYCILRPIVLHIVEIRRAYT
jgi:hypothetical protein